jgi:hypothetical protein
MVEDLDDDNNAQLNDVPSTPNYELPTTNY